MRITKPALMTSIGLYTGCVLMAILTFYYDLKVLGWIFVGIAILYTILMALVWLAYPIYLAGLEAKRRLVEEKVSQLGGDARSVIIDHKQFMDLMKNKVLSIPEEENPIVL